MALWNQDVEDQLITMIQEWPLLVETVVKASAAFHNSNSFGFPV